MLENTPLKYRVIGNGYPVVFIHGFLEDNTMWESFKLEDSPYKCILIDLPGHGESPLTDTNESPSLEFMASKILELVHSITEGNYHVVGHSMGGYISLILKKEDQRCKKVVLLSSNFWEDSPGKKNDRIRVADIVLKNKDLFVNEAIPSMFYRHDRQDAQVKEAIKTALKMEASSIAYSALAMRRRVDNRNVLKSNAKDFFILHGKNDPLISVQKLKEELGNIPVRLEILEKVGHMPQAEDPEDTLKLILNFLE